MKIAFYVVLGVAVVGVVYYAYKTFFANKETDPAKAAEMANAIAQGVAVKYTLPNGVTAYAIPETAAKFNK